MSMRASQEDVTCLHQFLADRFAPGPLRTALWCHRKWNRSTVPLWQPRAHDLCRHFSRPASEDSRPL